MQIKQTQKPLFGIAASFVLMFHLLPVLRTGSLLATVSQFILGTAYIGVDLFFFLAGYMMVFSQRDSYFGYLKRRVLRIYPIFLLSGIVFLAMGQIDFPTMLSTWVGISLCQKGGGSFLWFLPAVMLVYLLGPLYLKLGQKRKPLPFLLVSLFVWGVLAIGLEWLLPRHAINIFLLRIPMVLLGIYFANYEGKWKLSRQCFAGSLLLGVGLVLTWFFAFRSRLSFPLTDLFYLVIIPQALGVLFLGDALFQKIKARPLCFLGRISLELYCVQMVAGASLFSFFLPLLQNQWLASLSAICIIILISFLLSFFWKKILAKTSHLKQQRKPKTEQ